MVQLTPPPSGLMDKAVYDYLYQLQELLGVLLGKLKDGVESTEKDLRTVGDTAEQADEAANRALYLAPQIPFGVVTSNSTTVFTADVPGVTELRNGVCAYIMNNGNKTSASGWTLDVNGLGAKPVYSSMAAASRSTTIFNLAYTMLFVYNEDRVEGGCWDVFYGYDSNTNTIAYQLRRNNGTYGTKTTMTRYQILLSYSPTHVLPVYDGAYSTGTSKTLTTEDFNPFGPIWYYSATAALSANEAVPIASMWEQYTLDLRYSFNTGSTLVPNKDVFLVAAPQSDGRAKLHTSPITQNYPTTEDGLIYIYLGHSYSSTSIVLAKDHPIYQYKSGKIQLWTGA
jgi:hypothetical protein